MRLNHTGHSKAILVAAVALVALLVAPSLTQAAGTKLPITGGTAKIFSGGSSYAPIYPAPTAAGSVTVGKTTPAQLTIPTGVLGEPFTFTFITPVPTPPYIHLKTNIGLSGPMGSPAVFKAGPKPSRPAAFNFCPGFIGNPACVLPTQGTKPGIVKYTPGGKQFGGTMKIMGHGTVSMATYLGYTAPTIAHFELAAGATLPIGQTYGATGVLTSPSAKVTTGAVMVGRMIQTAGNFVYSIPGYTAKYTGFPWTTGQVAVQVLHAPPTYPNTTVTTTGSDSRNALGRGNITLVAGGLSHSAANTLAVRQYFTLSLGGAPVPTLSEWGIVTFGILLLSAMAVALRRRQAA